MTMYEKKEERYKNLQEGVPSLRLVGQGSIV